MINTVDLAAYVVHECVFNCPYDLGLPVCLCVPCDLSYHISYDMIMNGLY